MKRKRVDMMGRILLCLIMLLVFAVNVAPVFAASGIAKVDTFLDKISSALKGVGIVVCAIAFMWAGYKMMYQHHAIGECAKIIAGGLIVGGAAEIAGFLLG